MGKLAVFMAMKKELAFEYERELRAVRNVMLGTTRLSGSEYTIDFSATDSYVASSRARIAFAEAFNAAIHDMLLKYAHDLAHESLEYGVDQSVIGSALGGPNPLQALRMAREQAANANTNNEGNMVRLAAFG